MAAWRYALGILGTAMLCYHLARPFFLLFPGPDANMASFSETIARIRAEPQVPPRVLCLGSSRARHALVPSMLEKQLALPPATVRNYGMDVGTPWMALRLLQTVPRLRADLRAVFLDIEPWQFNAAFAPNSPKRQIFYRLATVREKLTTGGYAQRALYLADLAVPFMAENRPLEQWVRGLRYLTSPEAAVALEVPRAWTNGAARPDERFAPVQAARRHMEDYRPSRRLRRALNRLLDMLQGEGVMVVLYQPPAARGYIETLRTDPRFGAAYRRHLAWLRTLHNPGRGIWVRIWEWPQDVGLDDGAFVDYGHLSREGALIFSERFVRDLPSAVVTALRLQHRNLAMSEASQW